MKLNYDSYDSVFKETEILNKPQLTIDQFYDLIGNKGWYQIRCILFFLLHYYIISTLLMTPGFMFEAPKFLCYGKSCSQEEACRNGPPYTIDPNTQGMSVTREYELYCGSKETLQSIGESAPFLGNIAGQITFMYVSDNYGRKKSIGICFLIGLIGVIIQILATNPIVIIIGLFISGYGIAPGSSIEVVYLTEIIHGPFRAVTMAIMYTMWGFAEMLIFPFSKITSNWRYYTLYFTAIPLLLGNSCYFFLTESPKYLHSKNKQKTIDSLNYINKINNKYAQKKFTVNMLVDSDVNFQQIVNKKYSYLDLLKNRSVRKISIFLFIFSFGIHQLYYGIQFSLNQIGKSFVFNSFFTGLGDFIGYFASGKIYNLTNKELVCQKGRRKQWIIISMYASCLICISQYFFQTPLDCVDNNCWQSIVQIILASTARFSVSFTFTFLVIWTNELYPTTVRSSGMGIVFGFGNIGGYVSPFIANFSQSIIGLNPVIIIGIIGFICANTAFFLKETLNVKLKDEIDEMTRKYSERNQNQQNQEIENDKDIQDVIINQNEKLFDQKKLQEDGYDNTM